MFYRVVVISLCGKDRLLPLAGELRVIFQEILVALIIQKRRVQSAISLYAAGLPRHEYIARKDSKLTEI